MFMLRRTIAKQISLKGLCPFSGMVATVCLCPSKCGSGIRFIRDDLYDKIGNKSVINVNKHAKFDCSNLNTTISNGHCEVLMVEHILSSLWAYRIQDIDIHVDCNEIPMLDGSAYYWTRALTSVGTKNFDVEIKYKHIEKEIKYEEGEKYIIAKPYDRLKISYTIDFPEKSIGKNTFIYDENLNSYKKDISNARTFCTEKQVENHKAIKKYFNNYDMIVYTDNDAIIENEKNNLRYKNEATRHKILDLIGDLMSTGDFFCGEFICYKSGHAMNRKIIDIIYSSEN